MTKPVNIFGVCILGLMGVIFSNSMKMIAGRLNAETPDGVHFNIIGGIDPDFDQASLEQSLDAAVAAGATPILIGHSLGANMVVNECNRLAAKNVKVPLAGVVDPVDWLGNTTDANGNPIPGIWEVSENVGLVINPYQAVYPGGGHCTKAPSNKTTILHLMYMPQYPHAAIFGSDIGSCPETQNALAAGVKAIVSQMQGVS